MCGLYGWINLSNRDYQNNKKIFVKLNELSTRRGKDASGIWAWNGLKEKALVLPVSGDKLIRTGVFKNDFLKDFEKIKILLGHCRLATNGESNDKNNNQPIELPNLVLTHNGIVVNADQLARKFGIKKQKSDSAILANIIFKLQQEGKSINEIIEELSGLVCGTLNLAIIEKSKDNYKLILASNNGSLYLGRIGSVWLFASEKYFLELAGKAIKRKIFIRQIKPNTGVEVDYKNNHILKIKLRQPITYRNKKAGGNIENNFLEQHQIDFEKIKKIKRCKKCILPETTPFIKFDQKGICNYCNEHQKIKYKGEKELEKIIKNYRSNGKKPDCIIAFSGGRDSSYGLHYLVKKLKMHPVAVTFDWGMLSETGRRNQSRMLSKLGVEHIIVSADIAKVRNDIRKNLNAWLRKPDLGMVPLLMQGDKTTEYYVDKIKRELGVELVFFCRGNELEKEEFKSGYCGIKNADPGGVIHNYARIDKLKLLFYYVKQFLLNPAYINSSLWSSFLGYLITFIIPHNYIYLWHYIPWNEEEIINILRNEYGWEGDEETGTTWRIDDGSPAFYNYIYCQVQGFTENDSFRSRQIREGLLTRKDALKIVMKENHPRYKALKWYFDAINLNGEEVLNKIDKIKKRY
jgi:asparagine synthetase B (glutamine-hydrolysing)